MISQFEVGDVVDLWPWAAKRTGIVLNIYKENMILVGWFHISEHPVENAFMVVEHEWFSNDGKTMQAVSCHVHYNFESHLKLLYRRPDELVYKQDV